jgi:hypothetical protein
MGAVLTAALVSPAGAHTTTLRDTVEPGSFQGEGREAHMGASEGQWCVEVTEVIGHVGQMSVNIKKVPLGESAGWIFGHPKVGKTYCTQGALAAGDYSIGLAAYGGQPGSILTVEVQHP